VRGRQSQTAARWMDDIPLACSFRSFTGSGGSGKRITSRRSGFVRPGTTGGDRPGHDPRLSRRATRQRHTPECCATRSARPSRVQRCEAARFSSLQLRRRLHEVTCKGAARDIHRVGRHGYCDSPCEECGRPSGPSVGAGVPLGGPENIASAERAVRRPEQFLGVTGVTGTAARPKILDG